MMRNKGQLILGGGVLLVGLLLLISNLFNLNLWKFFWPLALIILGGFIIFRQSQSKDDTITHFGLARDINRLGDWQINNAEYWSFAADFDLDLTRANIPAGKAQWRAFAFVNEIRLKIPADIGVSVTAHAFVIENKINESKQDLLLVPLHWQTDNFEKVVSKFRFEVTGFVCEVRINQIEG